MMKKFESVLIWFILFSALIYVCFLIGKNTYGFIINPQNRLWEDYMYFFAQLLTQILVILYAIFVIKKKNILSLILSTIPLVYLSVIYLNPSTSLRFRIREFNLFLEHGSVSSAIFTIIDSIMIALILLLLIITIPIVIVRIAKSRKSS